MATSNEKQQEANLVSSNEPIETPIVNKNKTKPCTRNKNILPLVIAFTALAFTGYSYYQSHDINSHLAQKNKELSRQLRQLRHEQNNVTQELNEQKTLLESNVHQLEKQLNLFSNQIETLQQKGNQSQDWLLLKARYYLELAQINAYWMNNSKDQSTVALLEQADTILGQMNTSELFKIRQIIAKEILQLNSIPHLDIPGLLSQLDAIQTSIAQLHLQKTSSFTEDVNSKTSNLVSTNSTWKNQLNNSLNILEKLVIVRRNDEPIKPLLSPLFESLIKENLRLNIQEAQWAIINQNPMAYQLALKQAITNLTQEFNPQLTSTSSIIQQLHNLEKINLAVEKIKVGQALPLINELIEQRKPISEPLNETGGQK